MTFLFFFFFFLTLHNLCVNRLISEICTCGLFHPVCSVRTNGNDGERGGGRSSYGGTRDISRPVRVFEAALWLPRLQHALLRLLTAARRVREGTGPAGGPRGEGGRGERKEGGEEERERETESRGCREVGQTPHIQRNRSSHWGKRN